MAKQETIELTPQELEDIKDTIKFRECVLIKLNRLKGIPDKVNSLCIHRGIHWVLISGILLCFVGIAIRSIFAK